MRQRGHHLRGVRAFARLTQPLRLATAILLCGTSLTLSAAEARAADDSMKILTLNTWLDRFKANPSVMSDFFIKGNYDILTFQEFRANSTYARDIPGILKNAGLGTYATRQDSDTGVFSRLPGTFGASTLGDIVTYTVVDPTVSKPQVVVGTTHLNYYDPPTTRISEAKGINQWAKSETRPIILTGDFNAGDVSERGLHSISQQELLLKTYVKSPSNSFYLSLLRDYAKDQQKLDAYIAEWKGKSASAINGSTVPSGLFADEMYPVAGNLPQTMNILKKQFQILQLPNEREQFSPHGLNDGSVTWPSHGEDATNTWASWHRVKIDHFLASRPFGKWWTLADDPKDPYSGVITDVSYVTNPDGSKTPLSDHEPVAHTVRWVGPVLQNYTDPATATARTRIVWGDEASTFAEKGKVFNLSRNNMRNDVYLGQIADENGLPILAGLTDQEKKTLLDCKSSDPRFQQAIRDYCIDDHSFIGETLVTDGGTVVVEEDAALGSAAAKLRLDGGALRIAGRDMHQINRDIVLEGVGGALDVADAANVVAVNKSISGSGGLTKLGAGALVLNGQNTYTGATVVKSGLLSVQGSIASSSGLTIEKDGAIGGIGTFGSITIADGGVIAPGNSIGTLNVAGDINFAAGSTYEVEANDKGESDKIVASGKATLNGGSVLALAANGSYAPQTNYTILTAAGGVTGTFADVASSLVFLDPTLGYDANNVTLTLSRNDIRFADVTETANQRATAIAAESLGFSNAAYSALTNLDRAQARFAFDQLSGEIHASTKGMLLQDGLLLNAAATNRIRAAFGDDSTKATPVLAYGEGGIESVAADTDRFAFWSQAFGTWGDTDGNGNAAGFQRNVGGFLMGADGLVGDNWRAGLFGGYSRSSFDVVDRHSSGDSDNYHIGAYAGTGLGALSLTAGATYSWHRIETTRSVSFGGFDDSLSAAYDARTAQIFGEASYAASAGHFDFEGFANLAYLNLDTDGFREKGGSAALSGRSNNNDTTFTTIGVRTSTDVSFGETAAVLSGTVGWRHAFGDVVPTSTLAFAGGQGFTVGGAPIARDAALVEAGIDFKIAPAATFGVNYTGQIASGVSDHGVNAKLKVSF